MSGSLIGNLASPNPRGPDPALWRSFFAAAPADELRRVRRFLLVVGILALLAGVAAIVVPIAASVTMTLFIGWMLMFWGALGGVHAIRTPASRSIKLWRVLEAVLAAVAGFYLVVLPLSGTITLTFLLSAWLLGTGGLELISAWQHRGQPGTGLAVVDGVLSLVLGVLIAVSLPSSAAWAIGLLVGVYMLWWGSGAVITAGLLKRLSRSERARDDGARAGEEGVHGAIR
jgi:uncharacterized membrane protein HdeD (DUF308 family)